MRDLVDGKPVDGVPTRDVNNLRVAHERPEADAVIISTDEALRRYKKLLKILTVSSQSSLPLRRPAWSQSTREIGSSSFPSCWRSGRSLPGSCRSCSGARSGNSRPA